MKREYFYELEQGTEEWKMIRLGIVTASNFAKVLSKKSGRDTYMMRKLAEMQQGRYVEGYHNQAMENGNEHEANARKYYDDWKGIQLVDRVGFVKMGGLGCSPDGLVGTEGIIEIKCSEGPSHYRIVKANKMPTVHKPQVQGNLWIAERQWCDFISYDPWGKFNPFWCIRIPRDDDYINNTLKPACDLFVRELNERNDFITGAKL